MGKSKYENVEPINSINFNYDYDEEEPIFKLDKPESKSGELGIIGATFSVMNSVLGGGILSFPYAFAAAGIVGGSVATLILVLFAYLALMIIVITYEQYFIFFNFILTFILIFFFGNFKDSEEKKMPFRIKLLLKRHLVEGWN